jgi:hypothetical protein
MAEEKKIRVFEVIHGSIAIDTGDKKSRGVGDEIRENEFPAKNREQTIESYVKRGFIRDTALPLAPEAVANTITEHFLALAQDLELVTNDGATYRFGERTFKGRQALVDGVTSAELIAAIKSLVAGKDRAIEELTKKLPKK